MADSFFSFIKYLFNCVSPNKFESYLYFYEKGIKILKADGFLSFITPELFLRLDKSENIRRFIFNHSLLKELKFYGEDVFSDVKVNSVVLTLRASVKDEESNFKVIPEIGMSWKFDFERWKTTPLYKIDYEISPSINKIIFNIGDSSNNLGDLGEAVQGITPYDSYKGHSKELINSRAFHFDKKVDETCGKWLDGKCVSRYSLTEGNEWLKYGGWLAAPRDPKFFQDKRLLFREVPGANRRIQATFAEQTYYHGHSITPFKINDSHKQSDTFIILGIVNSKLVSWYAKYTLSNFSKKTFPKLNPKDIKELPIHRSFSEYNEIGVSVKKLINGNENLDLSVSNFIKYIQSQFPVEKFTQKLQNWHELEFADFINELNKAINKTGKEKLTKSDEMEWMELFETKKVLAQAIKSEIDATDRKIDEMVYELYGLEEDDIAIVEKSLISD